MPLVIKLGLCIGTAVKIVGAAVKEVVNGDHGETCQILMLRFVVLIVSNFKRRQLMTFQLLPDLVRLVRWIQSQKLCIATLDRSRHCGRLDIDLG